MIENESDRLVSQLLDELGPADPPAGFTAGVMSRIVSERQVIRKRNISFTQEGNAMTRKAMWGLAAAATITLAVLSYTGFPTVGRGTEGTIGAAKKFDAQQLTDKDVVLGDAAAQEFLQSAEFDRLVKDPEARSLLGDAALKPYLRDARFVRAIREANVRDLLADRAVAEIFNSEVGRAALEAQLKTQVADAAVKKASAEVKANASAAVHANIANVLANNAHASALKHDAVRSALSNTAFRDLMGRAGAAAAMRSDALSAAVAHNAFPAAALSGRLQSAIAAR